MNIVRRAMRWSCTALAIATLALVMSRTARAQAPSNFSADFSLGWNHGSGSKYASADWTTLGAALSARFWRSERFGTFAELGVESPAGTEADYALCGFMPGGTSCAPDFPRFGGAHALAGGIFAPTPLSEVRLGAGATVVDAEGEATRIGAAASADLALMLMNHVGVVGAVRGVALPHAQGSHFVFNMVSLGFRIR